MKQIIKAICILAITLGVFHINVQFKDQDIAGKLEGKELAIETKSLSGLETRSISESDKDLLAQLVEAEAKGEPYEGKVAVAEVVLNRVEHEGFPNTVKGVIYEKNAFQPVQNGTINQPPSEEAEEAVEEALHEHDTDYVYFYNPDTATSSWIFSRPVVEKIGNHAFAV